MSVADRRGASGKRAVTGEGTWTGTVYDMYFDRRATLDLTLTVAGLEAGSAVHGHGAVRPKHAPVERLVLVEGRVHVDAEELIWVVLTMRAPEHGWLAVLSLSPGMAYDGANGASLEGFAKLVQPDELPDLAASSLRDAFAFVERDDLGEPEEIELALPGLGGDADEGPARGVVRDPAVHPLHPFWIERSPHLAHARAKPQGAPPSDRLGAIEYELIEPHLTAAERARWQVPYRQGAELELSPRLDAVARRRLVATLRAWRREHWVQRGVLNDILGVHGWAGRLLVGAAPAVITALLELPALTPGTPVRGDAHVEHKEGRKTRWGRVTIRGEVQADRRVALCLVPEDGGAPIEVTTTLGRDEAARWILASPVLTLALADRAPSFATARRRKAERAPRDPSGPRGETRWLGLARGELDDHEGTPVRYRLDIDAWAAGTVVRGSVSWQGPELPVEGLIVPLRGGKLELRLRHPGHDGDLVYLDCLRPSADWRRLGGTSHFFRGAAPPLSPGRIDLGDDHAGEATLSLEVDDLLGLRLPPC